MKNTKIALLVYDITNKKTFEQLNYWINHVKDVNKNENIIFGIAANKSDLFEQEVVHLNQINEVGESINCKVFSTTATEYECIENLFSELTNDYYKQFIKDKNYIVDNVTKLENKQIKKNKKCC